MAAQPRLLESVRPVIQPRLAETGGGSRATDRIAERAPERLLVLPRIAIDCQNPARPGGDGARDEEAFLISHNPQPERAKPPSQDRGVGVSRLGAQCRPHARQHLTQIDEGRGRKTCWRAPRIHP